MTQLHAHLLYDYGDEGLAHLRGQLVDDIVVSVGEDVPDAAHILIGGRPSREHLRSPNLQALIIPWAGLPQETADLLSDFPHLTVHNIHHNATPVAEMVLALLLAAAKQIIPFDRSMRQGDWTPRYEDHGKTRLLAGKTALVLGYGAIGQRVARLCHALKMEVLATKRTVDQAHDDTAAIFPADALHDLLPQAHALLICLPLTPATEGLLGAEELELLPDGAVVVNVGRGAIVAQEALYEELKNGRIAAGLDVWYNYPRDTDERTATPPADFPFHELDNLVMSPHRGGGTDQTRRLRMDYLARLLNAAARGEPMPNQIDRSAGY